MSAPEQQRHTQIQITPEQIQATESLLEQVIARTEQTRGAIVMTETGVDFGDFGGVQRYAKMMVIAGCVPRGKEDDHDSLLAKATVCILLGRRLGLSPEEAVSSIYVVNARPTIFGDLPLALARRHHLWDESGFREYFVVGNEIVTGDPEPGAFKDPLTRCVVESRRKGQAEPAIRSFSIGQATQAGLFKNNTYNNYPFRMLRFRARGYNLRDNFGDALRGIGIGELADQDTEPRSAPAAANGQASIQDKLTVPAAPESRSTEKVQVQEEDKSAGATPGESAARGVTKEKTPEPAATELFPPPEPPAQVQGKTLTAEAATYQIVVARKKAKNIKELQAGVGALLVKHRAILGEEEYTIQRDLYDEKFEEFKQEGKLG